MRRRRTPEGRGWDHEDTNLAPMIFVVCKQTAVGGRDTLVQYMYEQYCRLGYLDDAVCGICRKANSVSWIWDRKTKWGLMVFTSTGV